MNALTERLAQLTFRERLTLIIGFVAALSIVLYTLVWQPWQEELNRLRTVVPEKTRTLEWMQAQAKQIKTLTEQSTVGATQSDLPLLTLIERSANQVEIRETISRMNPGDKEDQVRIWMDDAEFDRWLLWLEALNNSGVRVAEANIDRSRENRVNIRTTLER